MESLKLIILFTVFRWGGRSEGKKVSSSLECSFHVFAKKVGWDAKYCCQGHVLTKNSVTETIIITTFGMLGW